VVDVRGAGESRMSSLFLTLPAQRMVLPVPRKEKLFS
jgi:hypothetical protein